MKSKYDTNELEPDFPERVRETQRAEEIPTKQFTPRPFAPEIPTQRFDNFDTESPYQSIYAPQNLGVDKLYIKELAEKPTARKVAGLNLPENLMMIAPYFPFAIGLVAAVIELLLTPRSETRIRFHAAQGLAIHFAVLAVSTLLGMIANFSGLAEAGNFIFFCMSTIYLIYAMHRISRGFAFHLETIDDATNWLEEKIKPAK